MCNQRRARLVKIIEEELGDVPGVELAHVYPNTRPNYWVYPVRVPSPLGAYAEINYLEVEYQKMQRERRTSLGIPLPDYVQYVPGACPNAEAGAKRMRMIGVHHAKDPEEIREACATIRLAVEEGGGRS